MPDRSNADFSALAPHAHVADSLRGMAMRAALRAGDTETLSTITGRTVRTIKPIGDEEQ